MNSRNKTIIGIRGDRILNSRNKTIIGIGSNRKRRQNIRKRILDKG